MTASNGLGNIPALDDVRPGAVESAAAIISKTGVGIRSAGEEIVSTWEKLQGGVYVAPEAWELFAAMKPIQTLTDQLGWEVGQVGAALSVYANDIAPIKAKLAGLRESAEEMLFAQSTTPGGEAHWRRKQANVDAENNLLREAAIQENEAKAAAAKCANRINDLHGGVHYNAGTTGQGGPDDFWRSDKSGMSWGMPIQRDKPWYEDAWDGAVGGFKGFVVDGAWGAVKGVGGMVGFGGPHGWDWHNIWNSYKAIETLGAPLVVPGTAVLPGVRKAWKGAGKDFVAWDTWKKDKGRAAGHVAFNVLTLGIPESRLGLAGKAGDVAEKVTGAAGQVGEKVDPFSLALKSSARAYRAATSASPAIHGLDKIRLVPPKITDDVINNFPTPDKAPSYSIDGPGEPPIRSPHGVTAHPSKIEHPGGHPTNPGNMPPLDHERAPTLPKGFTSDGAGDPHTPPGGHDHTFESGKPTVRQVVDSYSRHAAAPKNLQSPFDPGEPPIRSPHGVTAHPPKIEHPGGHPTNPGNIPPLDHEHTPTLPKGFTSDGAGDPHTPHGGHDHTLEHGGSSGNEHVLGARFKTTRMQPQYKGEHLKQLDIFKRLSPPEWGDKGVAYLNPEQLARTKIEIRDGKLFDAQGKPFDTSKALTSGWSKDQAAIFVMDADGEVYAFNHHGPGMFHHSSFLSGQDVAAAGEIKVANGQIERLTDDSGHYRPTRAFTEQAIARFKELGVDFSNVDVRIAAAF